MTSWKISKRSFISSMSLLNIVFIEISSLLHEPKKFVQFYIFFPGDQFIFGIWASIPRNKAEKCPSHSIKMLYKLQFSRFLQLEQSITYQQTDRQIDQYQNQCHRMWRKAKRHKSSKNSNYDIEATNMFVCCIWNSVT